MAVLYRVVAPMGNYTDPESGNEKTRWQNCGTIMKTNNGRVVLKLDTLPINPVAAAGDDGGIWLQCFEADRQGGKPPQKQGQSRGYRQEPQQQQQAPQQAAPQQPQAPDFNDDDIPF